MGRNSGQCMYTPEQGLRQVRTMRSYWGSGLVIALLVSFLVWAGMSLARKEVEQSVKLLDFSNGSTSASFSVPKGNGYELVIGIPATLGDAPPAFSGSISLTNSDSRSWYSAFDSTNNNKCNWLYNRSLAGYIVGRQDSGTIEMLGGMFKLYSTNVLSLDFQGEPGATGSVWLFYFVTRRELHSHK